MKKYFWNAVAIAVLLPVWPAMGIHVAIEWAYMDRPWVEWLFDKAEFLIKRGEG